MKKSGQVYILGAILIGVALVSIFTVINMSQQTELSKNFEMLNENYEREAERFINDYTKNNNPAVELGQSFPEFTKNFNSFAKEINPDFGIITTLTYINRDGDKITRVINMLDMPVFVTKNFFQTDPITPSLTDINLIPGCFEPTGVLNTAGIVVPANTAAPTNCLAKFSDARKILLQINDIWALHEIPDTAIPKPGLILTSKSDEASQIQVFINEETNDNVDNSRGFKARCAEICNENAVSEDGCRPSTNRNKQLCCSFKRNTINRNNVCNNVENSCCRLNCKIFKNKETCELQNQNLENNQGPVRCCYTRNKCVESVWDNVNGAFTCDGA